ncbi:MAG: RNA polymerase sigma factor [Candidatus Methylomirabilia bacterium]
MTDTTGTGGGAQDAAAGTDPDAGEVRRARTGDQGAFEQLVLNHQRRTFNVAYRILGDYDEALEITQEVFLQAHRSLGQFRGEARFGSWLLAIAVNQCRNRLKHWKRRARSRHDSLSAPVGEGGSDLQRELPDPGATPAAALEGRQLEELVREELKNLDEEYRTVLVLRELQDVAYEEIARILEVPIGTVKSRLHRGRAELRELLQRRLSPRGGDAQMGRP